MSLRFRLYPTPEAEEAMNRHCSDARYVWNKFLEQWHFARWLTSFATNPEHKEALKSVNKYRWGKELTEARAEFEWLKEGSSRVQEAALQELYQAFLNWWKNPAHFGSPTFRSERDYNSFLIKDIFIKKLNSRWAEVNIPKFGYVKFRLTRNFKILLECKSARVKLTRSGKWYISFTRAEKPKERELTNQDIGIDVGVANTITLSNGEFYNAPQFLSKGKQQRKIRLQRKLAKQQYNSNRYNQTRLAIAKLSEQEAATRKDWIEKITTELAISYDYLYVEDLNVKEMTTNEGAKKKGLNKAILNSAWGYFYQRLEDKNPNVIKVNPAYTSRTCNSCGYEDIKNRLSQSEFLCTSCGTLAHADINAAKNILAAGLAVSGRGGQPDYGSDETLTTQPSLLVF